jgi:hypothetical protein
MAATIIRTAIIAISEIFRLVNKIYLASPSLKMDVYYVWH